MAGTATMDKNKFVPSHRLGMAILWFYGAISLYAIRINFGISIVCMTIDNETMVNDTLSSGNVSDDDCEEVSAAETEQTGEFIWDRQTRGLLNSAVFFGYILTQIPSGLLAYKLGAKWVHVGGLAFATLMSFLSPLAAELGEWGLFAARMLLGVGCGAYVSPVRGMVSRWAPIDEKATIYVIHSSGFAIGGMIAFSLSGFLCAELGWESTFYIPSFFMLLYVMLFTLFGAGTPEQARFISTKEKAYIMKERELLSNRQLDVPWKKIFTSKPCWALFITDFCCLWGVYTIMTSGAQYMNDVLKFDITANGIYNAVPGLCSFVALNLVGPLFDLFYRRCVGRISKTNIRKIAASIGLIGPAMMMLGMTFMDCHSSGVAISLLCISSVLGSFISPGLYVNGLELAPAYTSVIGGIQNTFGTAAGAIAPIVAGALVPTGTQQEWARVFYLGIGVSSFGWIVYMILADAEVQSWAISQHGETDISKQKTDIAKTSIIGDEKHYTSAGEWNIGYDLHDRSIETHL